MAKRRTQEERIHQLKELHILFKDEYFNIKDLKIEAGLRNLLYYNRKQRWYLDVNKHNEIKFPPNPNFLKMIDVYLDQQKVYNRKKPSKMKTQQIQLEPIASSVHNDKQIATDALNTISLNDQLKHLRNVYGDRNFFNEVSLMMSRAGYEGNLVKKEVLHIGM